MSGGETPRIVIGPPQVRCVDMEDYARIFNEGFDEARRQCEADVRTAYTRALKEAAAEQRRLSAEARTDNGQAHDGACETCPCCSAGFCVYGLDGLPDDPEDVGRWLEIAAGHNPVAALLKDRCWSASSGTEGGERDEARLGLVTSDEQGLGTCSPEPVHLIADGEAVTSCCCRTPFELPRSERLTVDPALVNCAALPDNLLLKIANGADLS